MNFLRLVVNIVYLVTLTEAFYIKSTSSRSSILQAGDGHDLTKTGRRPVSISQRKRERRDIKEKPMNKDMASELFDLARPSNEAAMPIIIPDPSLQEIDFKNSVHFYGLDDLFPNLGISHIFNSDCSFRDALRTAARDDFYVMDETLSLQANLLLKDPRSSLMSSWLRGNEYCALTRVFNQYGIALTGVEFINKLSSFCKASPYHFGSWIDITGTKNKHIHHSWHQDSGLDQVTVMLGFPPCDSYEGVGVFSHVFKLSKRLPTPKLREPRLWICSDNSYPLGDLSPKIEEEFIIRPLYKAGKEVMVYNDCDVYHSAPDRTYRESVWRFM